MRAAGDRPECETCAKRLRGKCIVFRAFVPPGFLMRGECTAYAEGTDGEWRKSEEYERNKETKTGAFIHTTNPMELRRRAQFDRFGRETAQEFDSGAHRAGKPAGT